jgi:hypothetical protein
MMRDEHSPAVPELARRMTVSSCHHDSARALVPVLSAMPRHGAPLGDILADSGLRPPRRQRLGHPAARRRRPAGPGPAPARPRPPRHPLRRHHRQRQPLLPGHPPSAAGTRPAGPRRHPRPGRRTRHSVRRTRPLQARQDHQRRCRRLPPGDVPRRHGQDPLPAPARLHDPGPAGTTPDNRRYARQVDRRLERVDAPRTGRSVRADAGGDDVPDRAPLRESSPGGVYGTLLARAWPGICKIPVEGSISGTCRRRTGGCPATACSFCAAR